MVELVPVLTKDEISGIVKDLAEKISADHGGRELMVVGILKGSLIFMADLIRLLSVPVKIDFVRVASYGDSDESSCEMRCTKDVETDIRGKSVLLVEDIIDTGFTLNWLLERFRSREPESLRVCALLDKHERREVDIKADYVGKSVKEGFLVGYGLDYAERYRNLPEIFNLKL